MLESVSKIATHPGVQTEGLGARLPLDVVDVWATGSSPVAGARPCSASPHAPGLRFAAAQRGSGRPLQLSTAAGSRPTWIAALHGRRGTWTAFPVLGRRTEWLSLTKVTFVEVDSSARPGLAVGLDDLGRPVSLVVLVRPGSRTYGVSYGPEEIAFAIAAAKPAAEGAAQTSRHLLSGLCAAVFGEPILAVSKHLLPAVASVSTSHP